jgi:hypothetical protein
LLEKINFKICRGTEWSLFLLSPTSA